MPEIVERREVLVRDGDRELAFIAEPDDGRLTIVDRGGGDDEVCAIHLGDREELTAFVEGLRRVLTDSAAGRTDAPPEEGEPPRPPALGSRGGSDGGEGQAAGDDGDREEQVRRARQRHPQAFAAWTPDEEQRLLDAQREGTSVADLARSHGRSQRAIEMRLDKLSA